MPPESSPGMQERLSSSSSPSSQPTAAASDTSSPSTPAGPADPDAADTADTADAATATGSNHQPDPSHRETSTETSNIDNDDAASSRASPAAPRSEDRDSSTSSLALRPAASSPPSARSSFLSRLSLPLSRRTRNRNVVDFHIQPHEPHRTYSPGEHVRGSVVLVVVKPLRITHLTVTLHGHVRVFKDAAASAKAQSQLHSLPQGTFDRPRYHGNGVASLFQDEQVLSGDGRLDAGKYEFGFDLVFPSKGLPSSIDFERGTISYIIAATLTRPTSIAATTSCDRKVTLVSKIDIASLRAPSPRTIFLEPITKRTRRKKSSGLERAATANPDAHELASESGSGALSVLTEESQQERAAESRNPDQSDIRSEISASSGLSISTSGLSRSDLAQVASAKQQVVDDKTITATVALTRGGCLPGDTVSVRVTVQHIKQLKSLHGVVVTLFRQGKIDSAPPSSMFTDMMTREDKRRLEREETRSKAGLGGLSLSSSGSTSIFRKDLDQTTAPLIVDPTTLQSSVTVAVRLPDDVFPTIKGVPGDMMSFRYQIEVIVDLGGRLSNKFKGGSGQESRHGQGGGSSLFDGASANYSSRRGTPITDTSPLRREKGVISVSMETVVGTIDSSQAKTQSHATPPSRTVRTTLSEEDMAYHSDQVQQDDAHYGTPFVNGRSSNGYFHSQHGGSRSYGHAPTHQPTTPGGPPQPYPYQIGEAHHHGGHTAPAYVPPPQVPEHGNMTEKERVRLAETTLLPSQPPSDPSGSAPAGPSAPGEEDLQQGPEDTPRPPHANPSSPREETMGAPSAPTHEDLSSPPEQPAVRDKLEMERQRLMGEASMPPEFPEDMGAGRRATAGRDMTPNAEPSAPVLAEEDEGYDYDDYGAEAGPSRSAAARDHNEQLPAYER